MKRGEGNTWEWQGHVLEATTANPWRKGGTQGSSAHEGQAIIEGEIRSHEQHILSISFILTGFSSHIPCLIPCLHLTKESSSSSSSTAHSRDKGVLEGKNQSGRSWSEKLGNTSCLMVCYHRNKKGCKFVNLMLSSCVKN